MNNLVVRGGHVLTPVAERFQSVYVKDGLIYKLSDASSDNDGSWQVVDAEGCYVTPGLVDLQVNGDPNCSLWGDPTADEVALLQADMAQAGVTSFLPTLITDEAGHLKKNIALLTSMGAGSEVAWRKETHRARMLGIHLEGPCLSDKRPGVHPPQWIRTPTKDFFQDVVNDSVRLVTMACELDKGNQCADFLHEKNIVVSLGHSNATSEEAKTAFNDGVAMMTHTFNALPPLHHRETGAVMAALLNKDVSCCVIADGLHLAPDTVDLIYRMKGLERTILVTDIARVGTTGGGLVGSSITLDMAVRNLVSWGIASFREAIYMAAFNPACALGLGDKVGQIKEGALADLLIWDKQTLALKHVIMSGHEVLSASSC